MIYVNFDKGLRPARSANDARYPNLWRRLCAAWNPTYATPSLFEDLGPMKMDLTLTDVDFVQSQFGRVMSFNGTTSTAIAPINVPRFTGDNRFHRLCGNGGVVDTGATISISTWIAPVDSTAVSGIVKWGGKQNGSGGFPAALYTNNQVAAVGQFAFCMYRANTGVEFTQNSPQNLFNDDEWCHLVVTLQAGEPPSLAATCKLYFNGYPVTVTTVGNWTITNTVFDTRSTGNGEPMMLGAGGIAAPAALYEGLMGETLIWDRVLSPAEVVQLFTGASPLTRKPFRPAIGNFGTPATRRPRTKVFVVA